MFDFPIHTNQIRSRGSSRQSNASGPVRRGGNNSKSYRTQIGASPLTSKELDFGSRRSQERKEYTNTFADNYKNGLKPSERMKKFNASQVPLLNSQQSYTAADEEYNRVKAQGITQNLRLLKTKMRLSSATSQDVDVYSNMSDVGNGNRVYKGNS